MTSKPNTQCGYVAIVGKTNVGKSTLLNRLLNQKLVIVSRKPQTTRHRILGIKTTEHIQTLYLDTPGLHTKEKNVLNRYMNRSARSVFYEVDVIVWMVAGNQWDENDALVLTHLKQLHTPVILAINKIDRLTSRVQLLPLIKTLDSKHTFAEIVPISALKNQQVERLEKVIHHYLPMMPFCYGENQLTDCGDAFIAAEMIREKLMRQLSDELPYDTLVAIDAMEHKTNIVNISATIFVNKSNQKPIVVGKKGQRAKKIGTQARIDLEHFFSKKVFLKIWVKVKADWANHTVFLNQFGHTS
jgi:GTP-binding protein Era